MCYDLFLGVVERMPKVGYEMLYEVKSHKKKLKCSVEFQTLQILRRAGGNGAGDILRLP